MTMKIRFGLFIFCFPLLAFAQSTPLDAVITKATIKNGKVYVSGYDGIPGESVRWLTSGWFSTNLPVVTTVDEEGKFRFVTSDLPVLPRCYAEVLIGDREQEMTVHVDNCEGTVAGFYTATLYDEEGDTIAAWVGPGERGSAGADCNPGDWAVSVTHSISSETNEPPNVSVIGSSLVIDGSTRIQGGGVTIINHSMGEVRLISSVMCARVEPPASRTPKKKNPWPE